MLQATKVKGLFLFIFLTIMLAVPSVYAVTVPIDNYSFETSSAPLYSSPGYGYYTTVGFDDWSYEGSGIWGKWQYTTYQYSVMFPDRWWIGYLENGSIYQDTGWEIQADNEFTLQVDIGNRLDHYLGDYSVDLLAGENVLASGGSIIPPDGKFSTLVLSYTALADDFYIGSTLGIRISGSGQQLNFDNIRLTNDYVGSQVPPTEPPTNSVPEPGTMVLLGFGLLGLAGFQRSRRIKN